MSLVQKALQTAIIAPPREEEVEDLQKQLRHLQEVNAGLLPVEVQARDELEQRIKQTNTTLVQKQAGLLIKDRSQLDPIVFTWKMQQSSWRRKRPMALPAFAYIPISEDECHLRADYRRDPTFPNSYPASVKRGYTSILQEIRDQFLEWDGHESVDFRYSYPGAIPAHVRQTIQENMPVPKRKVSSYDFGQKDAEQTDAFEDLALVCEVPQWRVQWNPAPPIDYLDPILVGVKGGALWILSTFDPTPTEKYLTEEFAKRGDTQ